METKKTGNDRHFPFIITLSNLSRIHLPYPSTKDEVGGAIETDAGLQERLESVPLPAEAINDLSSYDVRVSLSCDEMIKLWAYQA